MEVLGWFGEWQGSVGSIVRSAGWDQIPEGYGSGKMTNPDFTMAAFR